jgi:dienelactone hydrolase
MEQRTVHFHSDGLKLEADLLLPEHAGAKVPGIVLCPGFGATRGNDLPGYAARFAEAGYAALWLDYRGYGGSEGTPERLMAHEQVRDVRAALTFLALQPEVDAGRLGLWGTSGGAAHAIQAAALDERVRCAVAQVGHGDGGRLIADHKNAEELAALLERIRDDREQRVLSGVSGRMRVIDLISDMATRGFVLSAAATDPSIITYLTVESAKAAMEYRPIDAVHRIAPRALMLICAEKDEICPPSGYREVFERAGEPKRWVSYPIGHYDIYAPEWVERSAGDALAWFGERL